MCEHSDVFSLAVLIGRGLDHILGSIQFLNFTSACFFVRFLGYVLTTLTDSQYINFNLPLALAKGINFDIMLMDI